MRQSVDTGDSCNGTWLRDGDFRIENSDTEGSFAVAASHLQVCFLISDQGERLGLAAGASCGRHADRRQHRLSCFAKTCIIGHLPAVGEQEVDALGRIHRTAAADSDEEIDTLASSNICANFYDVTGRIFFNAIEEDRL